MTVIHFLDSVSLDFDTPEDDIRTEAKLDLQKKYGAKSSWKNSGAMVIKIKIPEEC